MSANPTTKFTYTKQSSHASRKTDLARKELRELDSKLQNLTNKNIIQHTPYILTVPSDRPYHVDKRLAHEWMRNTPFERDEEQLQYLSFLPDWDQGLIIPVGAWDNEKGGMDTMSHSGRSATGTPTVGAKKQKISLSDYKKKTTGQGSSATVKAEPSRSAVNGGPSVSSKLSSSSRESLPLKRSREDALGSEATKHESMKEESSARKELKPSPSPSPVPGKKIDRSSSPPLQLPPPISPSLPPIIEKELKRLEQLASQETSKRIGKLPVKDNSTKPTEPAKDKSTTGTKSNGHNPHLIVKLNAAASTTKTDKPTSTPHNSLSLFDKSTNKLVIKKEKRLEPVPKRLIVKLKIPRSVRPRCIQLLKTRPQPGPSESSKTVRTELKQPAGKTVEREAGKGPAKTTHSVSGEKRPRQDEGESSAPPQKRPRAPSNLDFSSKPSTPIPAAFKSPVVSHHGSAQKGKSSTPSIGQQDEVSTPRGAIRNGTPSAPDSVDRASKEGKQVSNLAKERKDGLTLLHRAQSNYHVTGRRLKHSCDRELQGKDPNPRKALALGIEGVLCFMLSYAIRDEIYHLTKPQPREATWTTIFPYMSKMKHLSESHPFLRGLCAQLEGVCHTAALNGEIERGQQNPSIPPATGTILKHYQSASELFVAGTSELSADDLQHSFPKSWRFKARKPLATKVGKFDMKLEGDFYLPLTNITTGVEAVRAGTSLLSEWCKMEGVQWEQSIGKPAKDEK